ncbi:MAG: cellulose binding domain-containing protein, partial [Muribaculum sp.]|nr:cellulose binding domain-containing protein [Muribaculum sp.]
TPGGNTGGQTDQNTDTDKDTAPETPGRPEGTATTGAFRVLSRWSTGFQAEITLTNTTDQTIRNWSVSFELPYEITNLWNGVIVSHENGVYTVQNAGYNLELLPGGSVTLGFCANAETESLTEPAHYTLIQPPAKPVEQTYEVVYRVHSGWEAAFNGQIEIRNLSSEELWDWTLEFDSDQNFDRFWNAELVSHEGSRYVIRHKGYNASIGAGQTLVLGFEASRSRTGLGGEPGSFRLTATGRR